MPKRNKNVYSAFIFWFFKGRKSRLPIT